jgi:hypothetical protein
LPFGLQAAFGGREQVLLVKIDLEIFSKVKLATFQRFGMLRSFTIGATIFWSHQLLETHGPDATVLAIGRKSSKPCVAEEVVITSFCAGVGPAS